MVQMADSKRKRIIKNVEKEVKFTTKLEESGEIAALVDKFSEWRVIWRLEAPKCMLWICLVILH
jgi:hypothetical protein